MEFLLVIATLLGGVAALWFFWDKLKGLLRRISHINSGLIFKVEEVRVAHIGGPKGMTPALYTRILVTNTGQKDYSIVDFQISEVRGPAWKLSEQPFSAEGDPLNQPIKLPRDDAQFICIRAESSVTYKELPSEIGGLKLKVRDHLDEIYELWLTEGPTSPI